MTCSPCCQLLVNSQRSNGIKIYKIIKEDYIFNYSAHWADLDSKSLCPRVVCLVNRMTFYFQRSFWEWWLWSPHRQTAKRKVNIYLFYTKKKCQKVPYIVKKNDKVLNNAKDQTGQKKLKWPPNCQKGKN